MDELLKTDNPNFTLFNRACGDALKFNKENIWIVAYPPIKDYREIPIFHAFKAIEEVKRGAMFWTANNIRITPKNSMKKLSDVINLIESNNYKNEGSYNNDF